MQNVSLISLPEFTRAPIDIHSHFNHNSPFDCAETPVFLRGLDSVESVYNSFGISEVGISTYPSVVHHPECVVEENEYLYNLMEEKDWIYQWVVIDPRQDKTYRQAEEMLSHKKVLGIKIHPTYHEYELSDFSDELFSFANERQAVVLMHPQNISQMPELVDAYPDMKLIIAHLALEDHVEAIANARHGNIYTDTSAGRISLNNIVEYAVSRVGSEKLLFGTDAYSFASHFGRIALSSLTFEEKENILWKNAVKMFPKAFA